MSLQIPVKELEEGKAGKSITGQRKSHDNDHKRMLNLDTHKQPVNPDLNDVLDQIDPEDMVVGIKEYYESPGAVTSTRYASKILITVTSNILVALSTIFSNDLSRRNY